MSGIHGLSASRRRIPAPLGIVFPPGVGFIRASLGLEAIVSLLPLVFFPLLLFFWQIE